MSKLLKVTLEYDDKGEFLDGEDAQKWLDAGNANAIFAGIHGVNAYDRLDLDWKDIPQ